jgi:hypothetical protein
MKLREYNRIQVELMKNSTLKPEEWIIKYSSEFRKLVNSGLTDINTISVSLYT